MCPVKMGSHPGFRRLCAPPRDLFNKMTDTSMQMLRNISHLTMIPLVILWFGIRSVDPGLVEMGRLYGLRGLRLFWKVILPGALPSILIGVRFALGMMWITLIVAETISADSGIGYIAMNARECMQMDVVVLGIVIYALLGKLSDYMAKVLEQRWLGWHPNDLEK